MMINIQIERQGRPDPQLSVLLKLQYAYRLASIEELLGDPPGQPSETVRGDVRHHDTGHRCQRSHATTSGRSSVEVTSFRGRACARACTDAVGEGGLNHSTAASYLRLYAPPQVSAAVLGDEQPFDAVAHHAVMPRGIPDDLVSRGSHPWATQQSSACTCHR